MTTYHLVIFALSVLLSFIFTRYVRNIANARGWVAPPSSDRHLHSRALPRLGGVAIVSSFLVTLGIACVANWFHPSQDFHIAAQHTATILFPALLVFVLGISDDIRPASPLLKFMVQGLAGAMLFTGGVRILDLPVLFGHQRVPWFVGLPLTILWVLAITNAFNLIDGLDGLAAGSALFSTVVLFVVALAAGSRMLSVMTLALAGATLGFLRFNFNPATIFLGDCGSLFIGFMLSALSLQSAQKAPTIIAVAIPVVSFGLPLLETVLSVLRRLIGGRPIFTPDREHIHHKLLQSGMSHRKVVISLYAVSAGFGLLSLFLLWPTGSTLGLVLTVLGAGIWVGVQHLNYLEFGELRRIAQRTFERRQIFVNSLAMRRAVEELRHSSDYGQICRILVAAFSCGGFDAFELRPYPGLAHLRNHKLTIASNSGVPFRWKKPGSCVGNVGNPGWNLMLEAIASNERPCGYLTVYGVYAGRDLQFDLNLLTSELPVAVADALERALNSTDEVSHEIFNPAALIPAQAI